MRNLDHGQCTVLSRRKYNMLNFVLNYRLTEEVFCVPFIIYEQYDYLFHNLYCTGAVRYNSVSIIISLQYPYILLYVQYNTVRYVQYGIMEELRTRARDFTFYVILVRNENS